MNIVDMLQRLINNSKNYNSTDPLPNKHRECLNLYAAGWKQNGFEHIPNSNDIVTFWVKDQERKSIRLSLLEQQLWVRELDK